MFGSSSQFFIMAPILPQIGNELDIASNIQGSLISVYALALGLSALFIGPVSDKLGRRNILIAGTASMAAVLVLHPLANDYASLLTLRILTGVTGGILTGSCVSYIRDVFPFKRRGFANGIVATGSAAGQILGIPIGSFLSVNYGITTPFIFFGFVMFISFLMVANFIPHYVTEHTQKKITLRSFSLKGYLPVIKNKSFPKAALGYILIYFSVAMFLVYFPSWLEGCMGYSSKFVAILLSIGGVATLLGSPLSGKLADHIGRKSVHIINNVGMIFSVLMLVSFGITQFTLIAFTFLIMLFLSGRIVSYQALISDITHDVSRGRFMCLTISIGNLGMGIGSFLAGFVFERLGFGGNVMLTAISSFLLIVVVYFFKEATDESKKVQEVYTELS